MDKVSKLLCFAWLKEIRLNRIIIKILVTTSFIVAYKYPYHDLSKYGWDWYDPIFGKGGKISLATMGLCTWEGVRRGGRVLFIFKSWLYMIFGVKHFWVHSIYYFMLLVQGVRLDWLVFHMISFLLMHILKECILTFDLWWETTFDGRKLLMKDDLQW